MAFKKGISGNPGGRPKGSALLDLQEMLKKKSKTDGHKEDHYANEFLDYLIDNYKEDSRLMVWMGDHLFGKAPQPMHTTPGEMPLLISSDE
jgi:uncharacterized protein DUF5681